MNERGDLEFRIKTLPGADWERVEAVVECIWEKYPEAKIYVEWTA